MQAAYDTHFPKGSMERISADPGLHRAFLGIAGEATRRGVPVRDLARRIHRADRRCAVCGGPLQPFATGDERRPECWACIDKAVAEYRERYGGAGSAVRA